MPSILNSETVMAPQGQWETFSEDDDDETLSLSDLPVLKSHVDKQEKNAKSSEALDDFEFQTCGNGLSLKATAEAHMCAADDIFYQGQLLPLRSCGSQSSGRSLFSSSNSISSSNCSSTSISRSQSSSSHSSICDPPPRLSICNKFYAHPSPRPQVVRTSVGSGRKSNASSGRRSTGSVPPGWTLFRLGVAKAPEIELSNLKSRRSSKCEAKVKNPAPRFGLGCKCLPDVSESVSVKSSKEKGVGIGLEKRHNSCRSRRMFEWLEELSIGKGSTMS